MILVGDFRQLSPVNARFVWKPPANSIHGAVLWQSLHFYPLVRVMRQSDEQFSTVLTKIGNGERLSDHEAQLLESRFHTVEWCKQNVPNAIRLFHRNADVDQYNNDALRETEGVDCIAEDVFSGYRNAEQLASARNKLYKMSVVEAGGLPFLLRLTLGMPYMMTTNVEVEDGIVNGAIGELKYIEYKDDDLQQQLTRLWLKFESNVIGAKRRLKARPEVYSRPGVLHPDWTPITKRSVNITLGTMKCKRVQFPVVSACALTIHKSQGGTFPEIVFNYDKGQEQQLVYVALSRVSSLDGLFLTNIRNDFKFHHAKGSDSPKMRELRAEMQRLSNHRLRTLSDELIDFIATNHDGIVLISVNVQSLHAHSMDISTDHVLLKADILALSETWQSNTNSIAIDGYECITQSKRSNVRAGGVAIYLKNIVSTVAALHEIEKLGEEHDAQLAVADSYGDICAVETIIEGVRTLIFSIYLSPTTSMKEKKYFLTRNLFMYARKNDPIVVTGDFNVDISKPEHQGFVDFMMSYMKLNLISDPTQSTTLGGTCIDLTFARNVSMETRRYVSYFSYHRPMISKVRRVEAEA